MAGRPAAAAEDARTAAHLAATDDQASARRSVLFLATGLGAGGAERQLFHLALGLKELGWTVGMLTLTPVLHRPFGEQLAQAGIPLRALQPSEVANLRSLGRAFVNCVREVRAARPDVLVGFLAHGSLLARVTGRIAGVPRIVTSLRSIHSRRPWHDWLLARTRQFDAAVVTNSPVAAKAQVRARVTTADRSFVIPNGFDPARVSGTDAPVEARPEGAPFTWLSLAGFRPEKGHATLLKAAKLVGESLPFRLLLAGEGPELSRTQALASELGILDQVRFLGTVDEVAPLIRSADGFVLASSQEGLPNALIEALAGGLPSISTDVGGCGELIEPNVSGWLVPPRDPEALAKAMIRLMDLPPEARRKMGDAGRRHVLGGYSLSAMVSRWEQILLGSANVEDDRNQAGRD